MARRHERLPMRRVLAALLPVLALTLAGQTPSGAAVPQTTTTTPPPPVSSIAVTARYDHTLTIGWAVPAAVYTPGASVVVRLTRGVTPAASPTTAYAVPVTFPRSATARPLTSSAAYTFAVWVRDGAGHYSARRTITTSTLEDVTAPRLTSFGGSGHLSADTSRITVAASWTTNDVEAVRARIVRSATPSLTGGVLVTSAAPPGAFTDTVPHEGTWYYFLRLTDASGVSSPWLYRRLETWGHRIRGSLGTSSYVDGFLSVYDSSGNQAGTVSSLANDGPDSYAMEVPAGRFTVCATYTPLPDSHFPEEVHHFCWTAAGRVEYDGTVANIPPAAKGAVDLRVAKEVTGVNP